MTSNPNRVDFCMHDFKVIEYTARTATGPNILGKEVTAIIADSKCILCDEGNIKLMATQ